MVYADKLTSYELWPLNLASLLGLPRLREKAPKVAQKLLTLKNMQRTHLF